MTFTLDKFQPQTVPVQPMQQTVANPNVDVGTYTVMELDPNPVFAELAPAGSSEAHQQAPAAAEAGRETAARRLLAVPGSSPFPPASSSQYLSRLKAPAVALTETGS